MISLIMDESPPHLISPAGSPWITGWGAFEEVLRGNPILVYQNNISTGNVRYCEAVAQGTQYTWDDRYPTYSTALIWRTADGDNAPDAPGNVLCLGNQMTHMFAPCSFRTLRGRL